MKNENTSGFDENITSSPLYSEELAPVPQDKRNWNTWHLSALWVGMAVCVPTYLLASYMIQSGVSWVAALLIIGFANLIITLPMVLNGHAGVKYGIPFPVIARSAFGVFGVHIPSLVRAIVACGWFGVQTWLGGGAIYSIWNALSGAPQADDLSVGRFICFGAFWFINIYFIWKGTDSIRWLEEFSAPILILMGLLLIGWGAYNGGGIGNVLRLGAQLEKPTAAWRLDGGRFSLRLSPFQAEAGQSKAKEFRVFYPGATGLDSTAWLPLQTPDRTMEAAELPGLSLPALEKDGKIKARFKSGSFSSSLIEARRDGTAQSFGTKFWGYMVWLTAMVGFWATMSLSISDITRFAKSQKDQVRGQFIGLPGTMVLYSFVGIFVTFAAVINFNDVLIGEDAPWDPIALLSKFESPWVVVVSQIFMLIATLSTNIAANIIAPANAFSNLLPKHISFRVGGLLAGLVGIVICPWWLIGQISGLLIFVSSLLGPVLGIMLCDYFVVRKKRLLLEDLYKTDGAYSYSGGFNLKALGVMFVGVATALVGYQMESLRFLYDLSWFTGFAVSFFLYYVLMRKEAGVE